MRGYCPGYDKAPPDNLIKSAIGAFVRFELIPDDKHMVGASVDWGDVDGRVVRVEAAPPNQPLHPSIGNKIYANA